MPVGEKLAAERRKQGRTLLEVEAATNIMRRLLELLEEGRYNDLPSPAYVRGYIQNYAAYLHLEPEPLLREFDLDVTAARVHVPRLDELPERPAVSRRDQVHHVSPKAWSLLVAAIVVVALIAWAASAFLEGGTAPPPIPPDTTSETVEPTAAPGVTTETAPPNGSESPTITGALPQAFTLRVGVGTGQASWVRVTVDGLVAYEGTLSGGQEKEWTVQEGATVRAGKPDVVTVLKDGEAVEMPRTSGIGEITLSAEPE
jgi:cytoskeletal protein RodZ